MSFYSVEDQSAIGARFLEKGDMYAPLLQDEPSSLISKFRNGGWPIDLPVAFYASIEDGAPRYFQCQIRGGKDFLQLAKKNPGSGWERFVPHQGPFINTSQVVPLVKLEGGFSHDFAIAADEVLPWVPAIYLARYAGFDSKLTDQGLELTRVSNEDTVPTSSRQRYTVDDLRTMQIKEGNNGLHIVTGLEKEITPVRSRSLMYELLEQYSQSHLSWYSQKTQG